VALPLPRFDDPAPSRYPYGARSAAGVFVGDLLSREVPTLSRTGEARIVAIARRPGVLSKVAIHQRAEVGSSTRIGADHLARVSQALDGERIEVIRWQRSASTYIADALGLGEIPPVVLLPALGHARVLLGEIDVRGIAGWRGLNTLLASALTGWRIRLEPVAATATWQRLESAMRARRSLLASVVGPLGRPNSTAARVELQGFFARLSHPGRMLTPGESIEVRITRMDPDEGRIFVSDRLLPSGQLPLI
jgi:transcription antitermination factor NusA-like protein